MNKEYTWLLKEKHSGNKTDEFYKDIKKLESGEPLAYVMGNVDFLNIKINLSRKVLIPRVETEFWVQKEIENIVAKNPNCLDIFSMLPPLVADCRIIFPPCRSWQVGENKCSPLDT